MANYNKVFLMGNLTRDPELRYTPNGTAVADFGVAVNRQWRGQNGEKREETCFVDITAWARQAEVLKEYMSKGRPIFIEGRLQLEQWEGRDGQKRNKLSVVLEQFQFIGGRGESGGSGGGGSDGGGGGGQRRRQASQQQRGEQQPERQDRDQAPPEDDTGFAPGDDDIPF